MNEKVTLLCSSRFLVNYMVCPTWHVSRCNGPEMTGNQIVLPSSFSVELALSCPKGGFPIIRNNEIRDYTANKCPMKLASSRISNLSRAGGPLPSHKMG